MLLEKYCEILKQMDFWIKAQQTGSPKDFAAKLNISSRRLYDYLDYLSDLGGKTCYCRSRRTYYYSVPCELVIEIYVKKSG